MEQLESDVVVVAAGTAGLAAAVASAECGARVIVFEKTGRIGGCGNMANGLFAVESRLQRQMQLPLTLEDVFKYYMEYTHWRVDARLVKAYLRKTAGTIDWLENLGIEFAAVESHGTGNNYTWHIIKPASQTGPLGAGIAMMKLLSDKAKMFGAHIILKTPVKKLIKDREQITGVIAENSDGAEIRVQANAVIIATGGFGSNPVWVEKYTGYKVDKDLPAGRFPGLDGDGIRMAWEAGAAASSMTMQVIQQGARLNERTTLAAFLQPNLVVNLSGERFINEEIIPGNNTFTGNAIALQKDKCGFSIFDENTKNIYINEGFPFDTSFGVALTGPTIKASGFEAEMQAAISKNTSGIYIADSLEDLAEKTGINLAGLKKTVAEYNVACETGRDELFNRKPRYLRPVKHPKFYVYRYHLGTFGSLGGIKINEKTEVLDRDYNVIPGLYAAGNDANSIFGDTYPITLPGSTMGFAVNSGRIAGENAAKYVHVKH